MLGLVAAAERPLSTPGRHFLVGVDEDGARWGHARSVRAVAATLGLRAIRITVGWQPGEERLSSAERRVLDEAILDLARSLRVVVAVYGDAADAPQTEDARREYCDFAGSLLRRYPAVRDIVVWNEPNSARFWQPQFDPDGASVAPAAYEQLLARCWSTLHAIRPGVNVIAASAPRGREGPAEGSDASHPPGAWYRELGAAYRRSGRGQPIFDTVGHNPYPDFTAERPWTRHPVSTSIGQGDHDKLTAALEAAFGGTGQPVPGEGRVTIWYLEQGFQTSIDPGKEHLYRGVETDRYALPAWSASAGRRQGLAPDQATQLVDSIRLAYCQRNVGAYFNFLLADEPDLAGWQSGILWADWSPKPSYAALKQVLREVAAGAVDCRALPRTSKVSPPEPAPPLEITDARVVSRSSFSATISWRTSLPSESRLAYGLHGAAPTLWQLAGGARLEHRATLSGLSYSTAYRVWLSGVGPDGQRAQTSLDLTTSGLPETVHASVARRVGALLLEGEPFFPLMVWNQCEDEFDASLAVGITLFAENACGDLESQLATLSNRALSVGVAERPGATGPGLIGYFHPDEADGRRLTAETLPDPPPGAEDGLRFLTLTSHFYSGSTPLAWGRKMYPGLIAASDVVGFDLYPLQESCRTDLLPEVLDAQRELVRMARGRPTFQWIEAAGWRCPAGRTAVTAATVRAEAWLAIAGGARGLGFFPASWSGQVGGAIARIANDVATLGPALFSPARPAAVARGSTLEVSARAYGGALYVIAVNASLRATTGTFRLPDLDGRPLAVLHEARTVSADGDSFSDDFAPLGVHVYVVPPLGVSISGL